MFALRSSTAGTGRTCGSGSWIWTVPLMLCLRTRHRAETRREMGLLVGNRQLAMVPLRKREWHLLQASIENAWSKYRQIWHRSLRADRGCMSGNALRVSMVCMTIIVLEVFGWPSAGSIHESFVLTTLSMLPVHSRNAGGQANQCHIRYAQWGSDPSCSHVMTGAAQQSRGLCLREGVPHQRLLQSQDTDRHGRCNLERQSCLGLDPQNVRATQSPSATVIARALPSSSKCCEQARTAIAAQEKPAQGQGRALLSSPSARALTPKASLVGTCLMPSATFVGTCAPKQHPKNWQPGAAGHICRWLPGRCMRQALRTDARVAFSGGSSGRHVDLHVNVVCGVQAMRHALGWFLVFPAKALRVHVELKQRRTCLMRRAMVAMSSNLVGIFSSFITLTLSSACPLITPPLMFVGVACCHESWNVSACDSLDGDWTRKAWQHGSPGSSRLRHSHDWQPYCPGLCVLVM